MHYNLTEIKMLSRKCFTRDLSVRQEFLHKWDNSLMRMFQMNGNKQTPNSKLALDFNEISLVLHWVHLGEILIPSAKHKGISINPFFSHLLLLQVLMKTFFSE